MPSNRRDFLAAALAAGISVAGCSQNNESSEGKTETVTGGTNTKSTDTTAEGTDSTTVDTVTTTETATDSSGATFNLDLSVKQLPDEFNSLVIEFTGFEFSDVYGSSVSRETDPVQVDLTQLHSTGSSKNLMETTVPAGSYDSVEYFISVVEAKTTSSDNNVTFGLEESVLSELHKSKPYEIKSGESINFTVLLSVEEGFSEDWQFRAGFTTGQ